MPLREVSYTRSTRWGGADHAAPANALESEAIALIRGQHHLLIVSFNAHHAVLDDETVLQEPARRAGVDDVLLAQDARSQARRGIASAHRNGGLDHDRPLIDLGAHEMNRAAVQLHSGGQGARMRIEPRERGQERGVNVEHALLVASDEARA